MHDSNGEGFAVSESNGVRKIHRIDSQAFREWMCHGYYRRYKHAPSEQALSAALMTLQGRAKFEGDCCDIFTRVAKTDEAYWLDLCDEAWQCVRITASGWTLVSGEAAPMFTRSASMRPLPRPEQGGDLNTLWTLVNIPEASRLLVLAWLIECVRPDTPYVVLALIGEQGSAKSSTQRVLRRLIDPSQADLRAAPKAVDDVWISAKNSHLVSLENLSHLAPAYQDALCVLATGGAHTTRKLYTNSEEHILEQKKPIVVNGISGIVTAQDLLDRSIHVDLPTIQYRETAANLEEGFKLARPALLGALLDLFSRALSILPSVKISPDSLPRMADFAVLGEAVSRAQGMPEGEFLNRYKAMRKRCIYTTIDASPVAAALLEFLEAYPTGYDGPLKGLLANLETFRPVGDAWPRTPKGLGDALRRLSPALKAIGVTCKDFPKVGGEIRWSIFRDPSLPESCPESPACPAGVSEHPPGALETGLAGLSGHGNYQYPLREHTPGLTGRRRINKP